MKLAKSMSIFDKENIILPEYGSTPHLPYKPNTTRGDTVASEEEASIIFSAPRAVLEDKVDASAVAFTADKKGGNVLIRNRNHILRKGYMPRTEAKAQYAPLWNYVYSHLPHLRTLQKSLHGMYVSVYGEWIIMPHGTMYRQEVIKRDPFIAYALYDPEARSFLDPKGARQLLIDAGFTVPEELAMSSICCYEQLEALCNEKHPWSDTDLREGVYIKIGDGRYMTHRFKMVRQGFQPGKYFRRK